MKTTVTTPARFVLFALACVSALTFAACGGSDDPAAVAEDFGNALIDGDGDAACELLSAELEEQAADSTGGECADAFSEDALTDEDREQGEQAEYETIDESEDKASVEVTVPDEDPSTLELIKEDGDWKIASI